MCKLRQAKVMGIRESIPTPPVLGDPSGDVLIVGWGSTRGAITSAIEELRKDGRKVSSLHLRHVWPLPNGLETIFSRFRAVLVPEMNLGQMARVLRSEYPAQNFISYPKVQGQPFRTAELVAKVQSILEK
jgi:2-oxoglutarate ferredoxin oxidoreductase subunit alpha